MAGGLLKDRAKRRTFAAREDLVRRIGEIAQERGYSLYDMVNEIFELAIKAEETGVGLREAMEGWLAMNKAKKAGFVLGLERLWYDMADLAYSSVRSKALGSWFEAGVWLAKRYVTSDLDDPFKAFKRDLEAFTWSVPEPFMEKVGEKVLVRLISPRFTESYTLLFAAFLEGALETFGYKSAGKEVSRGRIRLEAVRVGADA